MEIFDLIPYVLLMLFFDNNILYLLLLMFATKENYRREKGQFLFVFVETYFKLFSLRLGYFYDFGTHEAVVM